MNILLGNPWGLLALLGIPALVLIHFLQRKAKKIPISTMFLLRHTQRESKAGSRFERFVPSLPFFLQILSVLLLTWLLVQPRYTKAQSVQRVGIVLDSSASMRPFLEKSATLLKEEIPKLQGVASNIEIFAIESDTDLPTLYRGDDIDAFLETIKQREPSLGVHDPTSALRIARNLIGAEGALVYVSDHSQTSLPFDAALLSAGETIDNCGITGTNIIEKEGQTLWQAFVRNYSDQPQLRQWKIRDMQGNESEAQNVSIQAGGIATLQGPFPANAEDCILSLENDAFVLDDTYPLIRPQSKNLFAVVDTSDRYQSLADKIVSNFDQLNATQDLSNADLSIVSYDPLLPTSPENNALIFLDEGTADSEFLVGGIVATNTPLTQGLNWQALITRDSIRIEPEATDTVLLWQDEQPIILLREINRSQQSSGDENSVTNTFYKQLVFNFDVELSNAFKLPATAVLIHRFLKDIRDAKPAHEQLSLETGQTKRIAFSNETENQVTIKTYNLLENSITETTQVVGSFLNYQASSFPSIVKITSGDNPILDAAIGFGDTREADFSEASSKNTTSSLRSSAVELHSNKDSLWRLWLLLLLGLIVFIWYLIIRKKSVPSSPTELYSLL